jgi:hypothetical protein
MTQCVLDIVSEYPQIEHITKQMKPASMDKHGRQKGQGHRHQILGIHIHGVDHLIGNEPQPQYQGLSPSGHEKILIDKNRKVGQDQAGVDDGDGLGWILVF